jgi:methylthioribose-1-phosphate isomerase
VNVHGKPYRTIWVRGDGRSVEVVNQTKLPYEFATETIATVEQAADAIRKMIVRGAPLIGVTAAYGLWLALRIDPSDLELSRACDLLEATRPTAVNLHDALSRARQKLLPVPPGLRAEFAFAFAADLADTDVAINRAIGAHGLALLQGMAGRLTRPLLPSRSSRPLQIMTHCNAGWLATVDGGTALAPIYAAHDAGLGVHVWVSETRPRNQGAFLTTWELEMHGVDHTLIVDSAAGHLLQRGHVDIVLVGTDRTTAFGDVANKIGTYMKALAARDARVPFYVAVPSPSIDWKLDGGLSGIPIEERAASEVTRVTGRARSGLLETVELGSEHRRVANPAFDVTPARLVTGLITERGVCAASRQGLLDLFPEHREQVRA